ncbi:MAG: protein TolQ [Gammaproteobacteria bacterium]
MTVDNSLLGYFWHASPVVKTVLLLLFAASILSWTYIFQRVTLLKNIHRSLESFEEEVWSSSDLTQIYQSLKEGFKHDAGLEYIFYQGFKTFARARKHMAPTAVLEAVSRAMRAAEAREIAKLEKQLPTLATIGSVSPYVGLFGTVWGIMMAFHHLSGAEQVTIAMVAPGIAEALIATAMGLFAAIPAVIAYNRLSYSVETICMRYETFQEDLMGVLAHVLHTQN